MLAERTLAGAPLVPGPDAEMAQAVQLALRHAQARLRLPPLTVAWVSRPGGVDAETAFAPDRSAVVTLNVDADASPRTTAWLVLHECSHAADGARVCAEDYAASERRANNFAFQVTGQAPRDFCQLDFRRPSRRRREEARQ